MPEHVVTAFIRDGPDVLLARRSDAVGTYQDRWAGVSGYAEGAPDDQVWVEIREETGLDEDDVSLVRAGEPIAVVDDSRTWVVHPYLFDAATRDVDPNEELAAVEWVPPTQVRERETVPSLWDAYDRVRPSVASVRDDREHGSAYLSLRALDVLRDEAALAADWAAVAAVATDLLDARPDMAALRNRVNRAMHDADHRPGAVHDAAVAVARDAVDADDRAASRAAALVDGETVATLSRSGTVLAALRDGSPARVLLSESRPGGEGVGVADTLAADGRDVTLTSDAHLPHAARAADRVLVGADAVTPDGGVVNKVGTYALAAAAARDGVPVNAVCARDKVAPDARDPDEQAAPGTIDTPGADVTVDNPLFETTPPALVDGVVTETGVLDADAVAELAREHRQAADWRAE